MLNEIHCEREGYMALLCKNSSISPSRKISFKSSEKSQHANIACVSSRCLEIPFVISGREDWRRSWRGLWRPPNVRHFHRPTAAHSPPRIFRRTSTLPPFDICHHPTNTKEVANSDNYTSCSHPVVHLRVAMTKHSKSVSHARHAKGDATRHYPNAHYVSSNLTPYPSLALFLYSHLAHQSK